MNDTNMTLGEQSVFMYSLHNLSTNIVIIVICTLVTSWTILGNLTVILAVKRTKSLRNCPSNILVANLALSDLLMGSVVLPLSTMVEVLAYWPLPEGLCYFWLVIGKYSRYV